MRMNGYLMAAAKAEAELRAEWELLNRQMAHALERERELMERRVRPDRERLRNEYLLRIGGDIADIARQMALLEVEIEDRERRQEACGRTCT